MKERIRAVCALILVFVVLVFSFSISAASADKSTSNRFNVVLVLDASGSMNYTDPNGFRFDATKLFLGLLANDGNYLGSVVFNTKVVESTEVSEIKSVDDKFTIQKTIEGCKADGDTAIGVALDKAVSMLDKNGNDDLDSVIILLSDGKTDLPNEKDFEKSNNLKAKAINDSHKKDIRILTIGLNSNGGADMKELEQIAKGTDGVCREVKKANDLKKVFADFYNLIYATSTTTIFDGKIPSNGKIEETFEIPDAGVEEVNIIISSSSTVKNLQLTPPEQEKMSINEVKDITITSKSFSITKITSPKGGVWLLNAEGKPGDKVKIEMVYNDCLSVDTEYDDSISYHKGDTVTINGYLYNKNEKAVSGYEDFEATLFLEKTTNNTDEQKKLEEIPMSIGSDSYTCDITFDEIGTYEMYMQVVGNGMVKDTKEKAIVFDIGNTAPVVNLKDGETIKEHFYVWPFITKEHDIDLDGIVTDNDGDDVKYSVVNTAFENTTYQLEGTILKIIDFYDLSQGTFTMKATDEFGASTQFDVDVSMTNLGIIALFVLGGIILLVLIIIGIIWYILKGKKLMGTVTITNIATGERNSQTWSRGPKKLNIFQVGNTGIDMKKSKILATGKARVVFTSSKKYKTDHTFKPVNKVTINSRDEVLIYADEAGTQGIKIMFESYVSGGY